MKSENVVSYRPFITLSRAPGHPEGETYTSLDDAAPEWLRDAVYAAHDGVMPDNWVYSLCAAAYEEFNPENPEDSDRLHEFADGYVDIYTHEVFAWAKDFGGSSIFAEAEEQARDSGGDIQQGTEKWIQVVQYYAIDRIVRKVWEAIEEARLECDYCLREEPGTGAFEGSMMLDADTYLCSDDCLSDFDEDHGGHDMTEERLS